MRAIILASLLSALAFAEPCVAVDVDCGSRAVRVCVAGTDNVAVASAQAVAVGRKSPGCAKAHVAAYTSSCPAAKPDGAKCALTIRARP